MKMLNFNLLELVTLRVLVRIFIEDYRIYLSLIALKPKFDWDSYT